MTRSQSVTTASVVIITRNRQSSLAKCLLHLKRQNLSNFEIIIVDNSTNDETRRFLQGFVKVRYRQVRAKLGAQPLLRNEGVQMAGAEIVAFIDDDGYADPSWLSEIIRSYDDSKIGAVGGRIIQGAVYRNSKHVGRLRLVGGPEGNWNHDGDQPFEVDHLQGTNMSFRKSVLQELGGWDHAYCGGYATYEESDMCLRIRQCGFKIVFNPKAIVVHGERPREGGFGRSVNASPFLAYYTGRNGTYLYLKNLGFAPQVLGASLIVNPLIETLRCLFGSVSRPRVRELSWKGPVACALHFAGVARGLYLSLRRSIVGNTLQKDAPRCVFFL